MEINSCRTRSELNDKMFLIQRILLIRCTYPESVPARHGGVTALAAGKVHQVDLAGDAVLVLLSLHQLRLGKIKGENKNANYQTAHLMFIDLCFKIQRRNNDCYTKGEKISKKKKTYLCLGHHESEDGVRSGALVIHPSSSCGTLLVAKVQPALHKKHTVSLKRLNQYLMPSRHFHCIKAFF